MRRLNSFLFLAFLLLAGCSGGRQVTNIALRRPAFHSSSIDFNATAQLAVDGIVESELPLWVEMCGNGGAPLSKLEHDVPLEPRQWTALSVEGPHAELSLRTHGFRESIDKVSMTLAASLAEGKLRSSYNAELQCLDDSGRWMTVKSFKGQYGKGRLTLEWDAGLSVSPEGWRFVIEMPGATDIEWQEWRFYRDGVLLPMLTSEHFSSCWVSGSGGREWIAVDLGEECRFSEVRLHWLNAAASGVLQCGADSSSWRDLVKLGGEAQRRCDSLKLKASGRWLRLLLDSSINGKPYILSEMEVIGKAPGSRQAVDPDAVVTPVAEGRRIELDSGWILARRSEAGDAAGWISATVPGTVLASWLDNGFLPDPNFGDNQQYISDSYFLSPFVYRCRFTLPKGYRSGADGERLRLHFDGINWKAEAMLNDTPLGRIEGAFTDASFDITSLLAEENLLEVTVFPPAHPGMAKGNTLERCATNGGVLGADNPTFHASVGWDWIPTIRGRNMGIWNDVWIERHGEVRILNPTAVSSMSCQETLPPQFDTTEARVTLSAMLVNESNHEVSTVWEGSFGDIPFSEKVSIPAGSSLPVSTNIVVPQPELWWPNGYGEPHLYDVSMHIGDSDSRQFKSGIRQLTYDTSGNNLRIWINGRRLIARGGNWGFSESNLRYRSEDYETAMRLHRHENFNLVRNWVGMTGDEEFYEAADRNGILVWQDFWLANPSDGPDPDDEALFMQNAENMLLRIRSHPCLLLWCGRNEGYPPESLDAALRKTVSENHPESFYLSSSADDYVSGRGPYNRLSAGEYWRLFDIPWYKDESIMFHSERGMPNFPNYESLIRMMPADEAWPPSRLWGIHDFAMQSAQKGETFIAAVDSLFGPSNDAVSFASRAQWVNYDGYRAMFESRSRYRRGLLLWMSHPAWPSMAFCTYDWFLDATAAYYACRKACEPLHIQWNPDSRSVEVVNCSAGQRSGLRASAEIWDMNGKILLKQDLVLNSAEDSTTPCIKLDLNEFKEIICLRLQLFDGEQCISHNDYVFPAREGGLRALDEMPETSFITVHKPNGDGTGSYLITNVSEVPALMLHLVARSADGSRILPTLWSDNYIHLMPGEQRELRYIIPSGLNPDSIDID